MSSGSGGNKQESLQNYEKQYLERLEKEKKSQDLQNFIFEMTEKAKVHETKDYIGFCAFCTMGVPREELTYKNNLLFHPNCFEQQGKNFPAVNKDLALKQASAKIELVQLKNLKIRTRGSASTSKPTPRRKTKAKKKKTTRRKKQTKRRPARRKAKRRPSKKRKKSSRASRRRPSRRAPRRRTKPKTRRRTKRSSSRRRRR